MYCGYDALMYLKCLKLGFWTCTYFVSTVYFLFFLARHLSPFV